MYIKNEEVTLTSHSAQFWRSFDSRCKSMCVCITSQAIFVVQATCNMNLYDSLSWKVSYVCPCFVHLSMNPFVGLPKAYKRNEIYWLNFKRIFYLVRISDIHFYQYSRHWWYSEFRNVKCLKNFLCLGRGNHYFNLFDLIQLTFKIFWIFPSYNFRLSWMKKMI